MFQAGMKSLSHKRDAACSADWSCALAGSLDGTWWIKCRLR